jgi:UDP-glucose 4-epimerase
VRVVVTGAGGFIGRQLSARLAAEGHEVVGVGRTMQGGAAGRFMQGDVSRPGSWTDALKGAEAVYHLAGKAHALSEMRQDNDEYFRINTEGTRLVLEAARLHGVRRFVLFSSVKAMSRDDAQPRLDEAPSHPLDEGSALVPDTPYGQSKLAAEDLVIGGGYVSEPVALRLCMVYGGGGKGNLDRMLRAVARRRFPPLPDVPNRRSMVHVQDVVSSAILAATHPTAVGEVLIVSDGQAYSTRDIVTAMHIALGRPAPRWAMPLFVLKALGVAGDAIGRVRGRRFQFDSDSIPKLLGSAWFSSEKIQRLLGFRADWDLTRALPAMVAELAVQERPGQEQGA